MRPVTEKSNGPHGSSAATRVGRNFSFRMGSQVLSALINVAGLALLGNYLHAQGYGQYAFYYALIPLIGSLGDLGVGIIVTREIARDPGNGRRTFGDAVLIKSLVSGLILALAAVTAWLFFPAGPALLICLVAAAALIENSQDPCVWLFRAYERQDVEALLLTVSQVTWLAGLLIGVWLKLDLTFLIGTATLAFLVRLAVGALMVSRMVYRPSFEPDLGRLRHWVEQGLPFGAAMFGVVLYGRVGVLLLQAFSTSADVAYFNVAYMLSQPLGFISTALSMSAFPILARYAQHDPESLRRALRKTSKYQMVVTLPATVGLFLLAERIIPLLFHGQDFGKAGLALKIMSLGLTLIFINLMARYVLAALDRQQHYLRSIVVGLLVNTVLGLILIPRFGFVGACAAYVGAELAIFLICQAALRRYVSVADQAREAARPLLAAAGMGVVLAALSAAHLLVQIAVGAAVYGALLLALKGLSPSELRVLRGICGSFRLPRPAAPARAGNPTGVEGAAI